MGSKDTSWEELACESLCSGTLSSTKISLNSCSHSGISEVNGARPESANNGFPRSIVVSSIFVFGDFGWLGSARDWFHGKQRVSPFYHQHLNLDTSTGGESISLRILSFSSLTVTWYCRTWWWRRVWRRCRMMPLLSWRCHWGWRMRTGRRTRWQAWNHDRNEVLRVALYPNPVFNEMWFLTCWSTHMNIRFHRKAFQATILLACFRGLS